MSIISVKNLSLLAGEKTLVKKVSFDVNEGEILALVGESGSGKTLTALSIMDLLPAGVRRKPDTESQKLICGKQAGMIFQEPMTSLNPLHTIGKQVGEAIRIHQKNAGKAEVRSKVLELLDSVGLGSFKTRLDAYPHQLSGGERQRVMIAMAIANDPALLIADEPTTALDVTIQAQILALLTSLRDQHGMSVLLITHDLTIVRKVADRVAILSQGSLVEMGTVEDIFLRPLHPYTKQLLAAEPRSAPLPAPAGLRKVMECRNVSVALATGSNVLAWKKQYDTILENIAISVREGTTLGIVGESGSGKTTLALALLRLVKSSGEIVFDDERIDTLSGKNLRKKRRNMQIVFQDPYSSLNPRMIIGDIIREGLDVHEASSTFKEREEKVDAILLEVGLSPEMKVRYPHEFSGGQRQRICIARVLILKPKLIILDEPTSALDISVQAQILDLLAGLQDKYRLSYIFISHDLRTIRALSHQIVVLQKGKIVESGMASEIFTHPKENYTRALLTAAL